MKREVLLNFVDGGFHPPHLPAKRDADYVFYELTRSICPTCRRVLDAKILLRDNKVYMARRCPQCGPCEAVFKRSPSSQDLVWRQLIVETPPVYAAVIQVHSSARVRRSGSAVFAAGVAVDRPGLCT